MKIEVGKFYQTRDGRKARIYATDVNNSAVIHGAVLYNEWQVYVWQRSGNLNKCCTSSADLVSEWTEPKPEVDWSAMPAWAKCVYMDEHGSWFYISVPVALSETIGFFKDSVPKARIPPDYAPKFAGRWQDSIVFRPD